MRQMRTDALIEGLHSSRGYQIALNESEYQSKQLHDQFHGQFPYSHYHLSFHNHGHLSVTLAHDRGASGVAHGAAEYFTRRRSKADCLLQPGSAAAKHMRKDASRKD